MDNTNNTNQQSKEKEAQEFFNAFKEFCATQGIDIYDINKYFNPNKPLPSPQPRKIRLLDVTRSMAKKLFASVRAGVMSHQLTSIENKIESAKEGAQISDYVKLQKIEKKLKVLEEKIDRLPISRRMSSRLNIRMIKLKSDMFETMNEIGGKFGINTPTPEIDNNNPSPAPINNENNEVESDDNNLAKNDLEKQLDDHLQSLGDTLEDPTVNPNPIPFNTYNLKHDQIIQNEPLNNSALPQHRGSTSLTDPTVTTLVPTHQDEDFKTMHEPTPTATFNQSPESSAGLGNSVPTEPLPDLQQNTVNPNPVPFKQQSPHQDEELHIMPEPTPAATFNQSPESVVVLDNSVPIEPLPDLQQNTFEQSPENRTIIMDPKEVIEQGQVMDARLEELRKPSVPDEFVSGNDTIETLLAKKRELVSQRELALQSAHTANDEYQKALAAEEAARREYQLTQKKMEDKLRSEIAALQDDLLTVSNKAFHTASQTKEIEARTESIQRAMAAFYPMSENGNISQYGGDDGIKSRK